MTIHPAFRIVATLAGVSLAQAAGAQAAAPAPESTTTIPEKVAPATPPVTDMTGRSGSLSDKLSTTNGVIRPESGVDPKIQKQAPATGTMPVIPPPGSPGGPTNAEPK